MKTEIFDFICHKIAYDFYVSNVPSTMVAKHFGITLYKARKIIKQLVADGLLVSSIEVLCCYPHDDEYYPPRIYRGYTLTPAGFETECYKKHHKQMEEALASWGEL